jgi:hypothetical protein
VAAKAAAVNQSQRRTQVSFKGPGLEIEPHSLRSYFCGLKLLNEPGEMRRRWARRDLVLLLQTLANRQKANAAVPEGAELALPLTGMSSVAVADQVPTDPVVDVISRLSRGGN